MVFLTHKRTELEKKSEDELMELAKAYPHSRRNRVILDILTKRNGLLRKEIAAKLSSLEQEWRTFVLTSQIQPIQPTEPIPDIGMPVSSIGFSAPTPESVIKEEHVPPSDKTEKPFSEQVSENPPLQFREIKLPTGSKN